MPDSPAADARWWSKSTKPEDRAEKLVRYVRSLEDEQHRVHLRFKDNVWLYHECGLMSLDGIPEMPAIARRYGPSATNLIEYNVDAVTALIARHRPRITVQSDGGDFSLHQRAKWMTRFIEADFKRMSVGDKVTLMFRDAAVFGTGVLEVYDDEETDRPAVDRCIPDDFIVDQKECRTTPPRQLHRRRLVDVDVACAMYPDCEEDIREVAERGSYDWTWYRTCPEGQVVLVESWHLPSGPRARDGRHTIVCGKYAIVDEEYEERSFPFIFYHWTPPITGFYGRGIADILKPKQARLNKLRGIMTRAIDLVARPRLFLHASDAHLKDLIDNGTGSVFVQNSQREYKFATSQALGSEVYADYERQKEEASVQVGASQDTAVGGRIPGIESAVAYRQVSEREVGRFANQAERLEAVYVEVAERLIRVQKAIAARTGEDRTVSWNDGRLNRRIPWSKVDIDRDMYCLSLRAGSALSRELSGRIQEVIELAQANALSKAQFMKLLDHPDLQDEYDLETAAIQDCDRLEEQLEGSPFDDEEELPPPPYVDPLSDLMLQHKRLQARYLVVKGMGTDEDTRWVEVLQRYRDYLEDVQDKLVELGLLPPPAGAQVPGMPAAPGAPSGAPGLPMGGDPLGANTIADPRTATPLNAPGGLPDAYQRISPNAMGLPSH